MTRALVNLFCPMHFHPFCFLRFYACLWWFFFGKCFGFLLLLLWQVVPSTCLSVAFLFCIFLLLWSINLHRIHTYVPFIVVCERVCVCVCVCGSVCKMSVADSVSTFSVRSAVLCILLSFFGYRIRQYLCRCCPPLAPSPEHTTSFNYSRRNSSRPDANVLNEGEEDRILS